MFNNRFQVIAGHEFFVDGVLDFKSEEVDCDGFYFTLFGPYTPFDWEVYRNCNTNFSLAMRRLTAVPHLDRPGLARRLADNQRAFLAEHKELYADLARQFAASFHEYTNHEEEARAHYSDPHPKKMLRVGAMVDLIDTGMLVDRTDTWVRKKRGKATVLWKLKTKEKAKVAKFPRSIVDLGVGSSLVGAFVMEKMKHAMANSTIEYMGGKIIFVAKPECSVLDDVFEQLINCPARYIFVYYSDDSCFSTRFGGDVKFFNLDISSCDSSHTPDLFEYMKDLFPNHAKPAVELLIKQCNLPLRIVDLNDKKNFVLLKPDGTMLYSGSPLTTVTNNFANENIGFSLAEADLKDFGDVAAAAERVGYVVTGGERGLAHPEELQFLKHSPFRDNNGKWRAVLNLGVLLRASGMCKGDLPGRGDLEKRANSFQKALLNGMYPRTHFQLIDDMKTQVRHADDIVIPVEHADERVEEVFIDDDSLRRRYQLTHFEYTELCDLYRNHGFGYSINCVGAKKIGLADYQLDTRDSYKKPRFFFKETE